MPLFSRVWRWRCESCGSKGTTSHPCDVCGKPTAAVDDLTCAPCTDWYLRGEKAWREFVALENAIRNEQVDQADEYMKALMWGPKPVAPYEPPFPFQESYTGGRDVTWRKLLVADGLLTP